jgi:hypothetical protein
MRYAIVINLDYVTQPVESCNLLWQEITEQMVKAGFRSEGRIFTIDLPCEQACDLARQVIEGMEEHQEFHNKRIYNFIKDFFGFDLHYSVNLLVPGTQCLGDQDK